MRSSLLTCDYFGPHLHSQPLQVGKYGRRVYRPRIMGESTMFLSFLSYDKTIIQAQTGEHACVVYNEDTRSFYAYNFRPGIGKHSVKHSCTTNPNDDFGFRKDTNLFLKRKKFRLYDRKTVLYSYCQNFIFIDKSSLTIQFFGDTTSRDKYFLR